MHYQFFYSIPEFEIEIFRLQNDLTLLKTVFKEEKFLSLVNEKHFSNF